MKLLKFFLISQVIMIAPLLLNPAEADNTETCTNLFRPIENTAHAIKSRGGVWSLFEKRENYRKHAIVGLHVDSKITSLIYTINYVCEGLEGIPLNPLANQVVPMMKERGREGFIEHYLTLAHPREEIEVWAEYVDYYNANYKRKLDFNLVRKTIEKAETFFKRYTAVDKKIRSTNDVEEVATEGTAIIEGIKQFHATDPILKQVNSENFKIPHASNLLGHADEM